MGGLWEWTTSPTARGRRAEGDATDDHWPCAHGSHARVLAQDCSPRPARELPGPSCDARPRRRRTPERVSVDSAGNEGNGGSGGPVISADGRFVAFASYASNLVPGDTNGGRRRVRPRPADRHHRAGERGQP